MTAPIVVKLLTLAFSLWTCKNVTSHPLEGSVASLFYLVLPIGSFLEYLYSVLSTSCQLTDIECAASLCLYAHLPSRKVFIILKQNHATVTTDSPRHCGQQSTCQTAPMPSQSFIFKMRPHLRHIKYVSERYSSDFLHSWQNKIFNPWFMLTSKSLRQ